MLKNGNGKSKKMNGKKRTWGKDDLRALKAHSKSKTPVPKVSRAMRRTEGALRAKAHQLGIGLGHQR